ncbi:peptidoglycan-binding protein [Paracoccus sp. (in: a-proteobacteria)]|uniref:peptidoglycan-binding domain-containing protein n=1 Tax=Paracoccus sp. TaxID=267 RepID=UPI0035AFBC95
MRRFAFIIGAALPLIGAETASAEDVVIRIEAKRGLEAAQTTAQGWSASFPDVVTFPLADGWIGIALGPMPRDEADARLSELKEQKKVPADSFLSPAAGRELTQVAGSAPAEIPADATGAAVVTDAPPAGSAGSTFPTDGSGIAAPVAGVTPAAPGDGAAPAEPAPAPEPAAEPAAAPAPAQFFIRIESSADRTKAEEILAEYRKTLPETGLWTLPNGRHVIAIGPFEEMPGDAWLTAFKNAKAVPRDAFLTPAAEIGTVSIAGTTPAPGIIHPRESYPLPMPPLEDIQRALRWAGHYDGAIDGKDGPMTQAAIASEIVRLRAAPDAATAMGELIARREAWRAAMGLTQLQDAHTGLSLPVPMEKLQFDRAERALSIYGPKDGSGAALILFSQPGGQQEMLDIAGLVTALGWVPQPERRVERGSVTLDGRNQTHIGHAEGRVIDGRAQGFVLIWPISDPEDQHRLAAEISDNLARFAPGAGETQPEAPAIAPAEPAAEAEAQN